MNNITFGDEKFGHYETVAGGAGAVSKYSILASRQENLSVGFATKYPFKVSAQLQRPASPDILDVACIATIKLSRMEMGLNTRKPVFRVSEQHRYRPAFVIHLLKYIISKLAKSNI